MFALLTVCHSMSAIVDGQEWLANLHDSKFMHGIPIHFLPRVLYHSIIAWRVDAECPNEATRPMYSARHTRDMPRDWRALGEGSWIVAVRSYLVDCDY